MLNNAFMRRLTALLLCAVLVLGILVSSAVADETGTLPAQETTGVIETADPAQEEARDISPRTSGRPPDRVSR